MFMINPGVTFVAAGLCLAVFYVMERRRLRAHWGDARHGILMLLARYAVYRLAETRPVEQSWRPNILVLSGSPASRWYLIELADAITHGRGFLSVAAVVPEGSSAALQPHKTESTIREYLGKRGVTALVEVHVNNQPMQGIEALVTTYGLGPLVPNTILLGETEEESNILPFARLIRTIQRSRRNLVMVREGSVPSTMGRNRRIDVWWGLQKQNVGLMLALAYSLGRSPDWRRSQLTIRTIVSTSREQEQAIARLQEFVRQGRLQAVPRVVIRENDTDIFQTIRETSEDADLVFLGIRPPQEEEETREVW